MAKSIPPLPDKKKLREEKSWEELLERVKKGKSYSTEAAKSSRGGYYDHRDKESTPPKSR